jgi:hypothetical protein
MNIIDELKKAMNWDKLDEATAKEIVNDLEAGIEKMKQQQEQEKKEAETQENKAWSERVVKARTKRHNNIARKKKHRQLSGISAGRLAMLRKLGKIND